MAHLWASDSDGWAVLPLEADVVGLDDRGIEALSVADESSADDGKDMASTILMRRTGGAQEEWVLVAKDDASVRLNGRPAKLGIAALHDRDEIRVGTGHSYFFSTEKLAAVETMSGTGSPILCPRCKQEIADASLIVRCPQCGVAHHQSQGLPCWTGYDDEPFESCALCDQPAALDAGFRWTPEDL